MVAAETSTSSSNGMGEELPLRIRFQRTFNLARLSLVSPWRDWLCRREPGARTGKSSIRPTSPSQNTSNCFFGIERSPFAGPQICASRSYI